jgi:hypothetical protein
MLNINRNQFRHSAQTKTTAAGALVSGNQTHFVPAVYLCHVALECALKHRILTKNNAKHIEDLSHRLNPEDFDKLFNGSTGHDLHHLAETAALRRYLVARGHHSLLERGEWRKMGQRPRPFSVRYGVEAVTAGNAKSQVQFSIELTNLMLQEAT